MTYDVHIDTTLALFPQLDPLRMIALVIDQCLGHNTCYKSTAVACGCSEG